METWPSVSVDSTIRNHYYYGVHDQVIQCFPDCAGTHPPQGPCQESLALCVHNVSAESIQEMNVFVYLRNAQEPPLLTLGDKMTGPKQRVVRANFTRRTSSRRFVFNVSPMHEWHIPQQQPMRKSSRYTLELYLVHEDHVIAKGTCSYFTVLPDNTSSRTKSSRLETRTMQTSSSHRSVKRSRLVDESESSASVRTHFIAARPSPIGGIPVDSPPGKIKEEWPATIPVFVHPPPPLFHQQLYEEGRVASVLFHHPGLADPYAYHQQGDDGALLNTIPYFY